MGERRKRERKREREGFRSTPAEWAITAIHSFVPRRRREEVIKQLMAEGGKGFTAAESGGLID